MYLWEIPAAVSSLAAGPGTVDSSAQGCFYRVIHLSWGERTNLERALENVKPKYYCWARTAWKERPGMRKKERNRSFIGVSESNLWCNPLGSQPHMFAWERPCNVKQWNGEQKWIHSSISESFITHTKYRIKVRLLHRVKNECKYTIT